MKNKTLLIIFVVALTILALSVAGYFMNRKSAPSKTGVSPVGQTENPVSGKKADSTATAPVNPTPTTPGLSLADGNAKRYESAKYGFSLLMPKDYWYEEADGTTWDVGPVFSVAIERPGLASEEIGRSDGTTATSKFGILMSVSVCDRSLNRGKCLVDGKIDGLTFDRQTSVTIGGHAAQKFDDRAYTVVTDKYEYAIALNPALSDSLNEADMKVMEQAFENVVKTIWFK
ncbi:MAG: hypothetical protein HGB37_04925 [Candidatus Moranbacteria bacterium]|nr:hypothetical protein [Candidatus Moranbacteria bacterium]